MELLWLVMYCIIINNIIVVLFLQYMFFFGGGKRGWNPFGWRGIVVLHKYVVQAYILHAVNKLCSLVQFFVKYVNYNKSLIIITSSLQCRQIST
jgi:Na+-translocating ferredoxin:NAD+ oxidoreductase RnfA subunit